jgi:hypothetical protein
MLGWVGLGQRKGGREGIDGRDSNGGGEGGCEVGRGEVAKEIGRVPCLRALQLPSPCPQVPPPREVSAVQLLWSRLLVWSRSLLRLPSRLYVSLLRLVAAICWFGMGWDGKVGLGQVGVHRFAIDVR